MVFLSALAHALITLLGAAAESIGYDRLMKANTVKTRTHSLFRQGSYWFTRIPNMSVEKLAPLLAALERQIATHAVFKKLFRGAVGMRGLFRFLVSGDRDGNVMNRLRGR